MKRNLFLLAGVLMVSSFTNAKVKKDVKFTEVPYGVCSNRDDCGS